MLGCNDWLFGTVDLTSGEFTTILDMRLAEHFAQCEGQPPTHEAAKVQLLDAYCKVGHYPEAPLCRAYGQTGLFGGGGPAGGSAGSAAAGASAGTRGGTGASGGSVAAGTAGADGSGSAAAAMGGTSAGTAASGSKSKASGGGCAIAAPYEQSGRCGALLSALGFATLAASRVRRKRSLH